MTTEIKKVAFVEGTSVSIPTPNAGLTADDNYYTLENAGLAVSISSNTMIVRLKQKDGSTDPTVGNPVRVSFHPTANLGTYTIEEITSALSLTIVNGATLGQFSTYFNYIYVYLLDTGSGVKIGVSSAPLKETDFYTTVAMGTGADSALILYSDAIYTDIPIRMLGRIKHSQSTAGTYASIPSDIEIGAYNLFDRNEKENPNIILNGNMDFCQAGTSVTDASVTLGAFSYLFDNIPHYVETAAGTYTISQDLLSSLDKDAIRSNARYAFRWNQTGGNASNTANHISAYYEWPQALHNKVLNYSFYMIAASGTPAVELYAETANVTNGFSSSVRNINLSTGWIRFTGQFQIPSLSTAVYSSNSLFRFQWRLPSGNTTFDIRLTNVDMWLTDINDKVDFEKREFQYASGNFNNELNALRRYYLRYNESEGAGIWPSLVVANNTLVAPIRFPVKMRSTPVLETSTNSITFLNGGSGTYTPTLYGAGTEGSGIQGTVGGFTKDQNPNICYLSAGGYIAFNSRL